MTVYTTAEAAELLKVCERTIVYRDNGVVYFIRGVATGLIKIGWAQDVFKRMRVLQANSPDKLELLGGFLGGVRDEDAIHEKFKDDRSHNEWFRPTPKLLMFIERRARRIEEYRLEAEVAL